MSTPATLTVKEVDLLRVMSENEHLRKQRDELQAKLTAWQEGKLSRCVRGFMTEINQEVRHRPSVPSEAVVRLRLRLVTEEAIELVAACVGTDEVLVGKVEHAADLLNDAIALVRAEDVDLPAFADALADIRYVVVGSDAAFGINGDAVDALVHAKNLEKISGQDDEHGKRQKPPGFVPLDLTDELVRQGWER